MKIISAMSEKGGVGRSSLCIHLVSLALADGFKVALADFDKHAATSSAWASRRVDTDNLSVFRPKIDEAAELVEYCKGEGFDLLIADCPPYMDNMPDALTTGVTLLPARPSMPDIEALSRAVANVNGRYFVVLNQTPPKKNGFESPRVTSVKKSLDEAGVPYSPVSICQRWDFADSLAAGKTVTEYSPESASAMEMWKLWKFVKKEVM